MNDVAFAVPARIVKSEIQEDIKIEQWRRG